MLTAAAFRFNESVARKIIAEILTLSPTSPQIPETVATGYKDEALFFYQVENQSVAVSAEIYRQQFNARFVRRLPRNLANLRETSEEMVVEVMDVRAARANGVDREPQFVEDRRGFTYMQVLDRYEKDTVLPRLHPSQSDIKRYYHEHQDEFQQVVTVRGRLQTFSNSDSAAPSSEELISISRDSLPKVLEQFRAIIFQAPCGFRIGPVIDGDHSCVFIKDQNSGTGLVPLEEASPVIESTLERERLTKEERRIAVELASHFRIQDNIDYRQYGLDPSTISTPWSK